ncbi:MAG: LysM peptidoglycan-binding domain-containing protein [Luteimonas sp.]
MNTPRKPGDRSSGPDPESLSLAPGKSGSADFSRVSSRFTSTEEDAGKTDFGRVRSSVSSTEDAIGHRQYTVQKGDTLSHIAQHHYGKASGWTRIYEANRDQLDDPDRIYPGQVLKIPAAD